MAMIKCPECGKEISDKSEVCVNCGYPISSSFAQDGEANKPEDQNAKVTSNEGDKIKFKLPIVPTLIAAVIMVLAAIGIIYFTNNVNKAKKFFTENDVASFKELESSMKNEDIVKFNEYLQGEVQSYCEDYVAQKVSYDDTISKMQTVSEFLDSEYEKGYKEQLKFIKDLKASRDAFDSGIKAEADNDYEGAINNYQNVIKSDSNYDGAQASLDKLIPIYTSELKSNAEGLVKDNNYSEAIDLLKKAQKYDSNDTEIEELIKSYQATYDEIKKKEAEQKAEEERQEALLFEGKVITTKNTETTFLKAVLTDAVYPNNRSGYYTYFTVNDNNTIWLDIQLSVKNTSTSLFNLYAAVDNLQATYNNKYKYNSCGLYISQGNSIEKLYEYFSNSISALDVATLHIVVPLPRECRDNDAPIQATFRFDGKKQLLEFR